MPYCVFVSHGWHDRWIAKQMASNIRNETGAEVFIDIFLVNSRFELRMLPMLERSRRIFISYSFEDRSFAKRLGNLLKNRGASVLQDADIASGGAWADMLRTKIEQSDALILVIPSRNAANRNNVLFEAGAARALGKHVFAVLPPEHAVSSIDLPTDIAGLLVLDADRRSLESIADTLLQAVSGENTAPSAT